MKDTNLLFCNELLAKCPHTNLASGFKSRTGKRIKHYGYSRYKEGNRHGSENEYGDHPNPLPCHALGD